MNKSDSERIAGVLEKLEFKPAEKTGLADLVVFNICSVRQSAIDRARAQIQNVQKNEKHKIILTGCILNKDKRELSKYCDGIFSIDQLAQLPKMLKKLGFKIDTTKNQKIKHYLTIAPKCQSPLIAYVPIMTGCNNFCSYCVVPYVRGREISRPAQEIVYEVENLVKRGVKEVWLLGQNVNRYRSKSKIPRPTAVSGLGKNQRPKIINFAKLLKMINNVPGDFWIRFTSSHPKDFSDDLIETMAKCHKVPPYLNLPIQSGDDNVLKAMNRPYRVKDYKKLVEKIRAAFKKNRQELEQFVFLSTDAIVGFPGETKKQFQNTKKTFKEIKFSAGYISRYSPRPQTSAAKLGDNISPQEKKQREKELVKIIEKTALDFNKNFINKIVAVLVINRKKDFYVGKTRHNQTVKIKSEKDVLGQFVRTKITKITPYGLEGKLFMQNRANLKKRVPNPRRHWAPGEGSPGTVPLLVVLGPTASGKSDLAVELGLWLKKHAPKITGTEIISADSRQVYKGMDIGSGKITKKEMKGIPHHLLDVASPKRKFTVVQFKKKADKTIKKIYKENKLPILCGGTGFYIQAVLEDLALPQVSPDWELRKELEKESCEQLYEKLKKLDPQRAKNLDRKNKRRLIRALEIIFKTKKPVPRLKKRQKYNALILGIQKDRQELNKRIAKRLEQRLGQGMIKEVKNLKQSGVSWKRLEEFGLEYRWVARYLQGKISKQEMQKRLQKEIEHYAKRQMTWFKKYNPNTHWVKNKEEAKKLVSEFLKN